MYPSQLEPAGYVSQLAEASLRLIPHLSAGEKLGRRIVNQAMEEANMRFRDRDRHASR